MHRPMTMATCWLVCAASVVAAESPDLAFRPAEPGYYAFDTGRLHGKVRLDGKSQGISSLVYAPTGMELLKTPGLFSYYRVFSTGVRYGEAARDWPVAARVMEGGALQIHFPPAAEHPLEITGTFRWRSADTLDLETTFKAHRALPRMEVFLSSYFVGGFDAWVYANRNVYGSGPAALMRVDWSELLTGNYVMFPRDHQSLLTIYDGRWEMPPNPVTWAFLRYLAAPLAVRRHAQSGLTVALMSPPDDCFAVGTPYNREPPDGVAGHSSLYLSLFGRDLAAGQTATAHCRVMVGKGLSDETILKEYAEYLAEHRQHK